MYRENVRFVLIVGYIGSGKTEACRLLESEFGYVQVPCSQILQDIIGCEPIEKIGRQKVQDFGYRFISQPGAHETFAEAIVDFIKRHKSERFVLDGLRYIETLEAIEQRLGHKITVIYIESTIDSLYHYYRVRETNETPFTFTEFLSIMNHPVEREIERFWPISQITIYNHGSFQSYMESLRGLFEDALKD